MGTLLGPSVQNYFVYVLHFCLSGYSFIKVDGCHIIFVRVVAEIDGSYMVVCSASSRLNYQRQRRGLVSATNIEGESSQLLFLFLYSSPCSGQVVIEPWPLCHGYLGFGLDGPHLAR
jgi:hypothetical protein